MSLLVERLSVKFRDEIKKARDSIVKRFWAFPPRYIYSFLRRKHALETGPCNVFSKAGGLGDELMAVSAIQAAVCAQPQLEVVFYTRFLNLFQGLAGPKSVVALDAKTLPDHALALTYTIKQDRSVNEQMAQQLGAYNGPNPIDLPSRELELPANWPSNCKPIILIQPCASGWTPNKQWPLGYWRRLVESMPSEWTVVEVGKDNALDPAPSHPGWISLVGKTTLLEYVSCFREATIFVGPVSSGMHLAHAYKLPSVIVIGGYEAAHFPYPLAIQFGTKLPCAPCGLRSPCPYDLRCLKEIKPDSVLEAIFDRLSIFVPVE